MSMVSVQSQGEIGASQARPYVPLAWPIQIAFWFVSKVFREEPAAQTTGALPRQGFYVRFAALL